VKAVQYERPREFSIVDIPVPRAGRDQILVKVLIGGVCGTDSHLDHGEFDPVYPLTPGHEIVGTIAELGEGVTGWKIGQQVVVDNASPCGHCPECGRGEPLFCRRFSSLGVNGPGAFAEYVLTPADKVFDAEDLAVDTAVLAEPLACAIHGMDILALKPGATVLMFGSGTTGLLLAQLILHGGASQLVVAGPTEFKLQLASRFGVDRIVQISRDDSQAALAQCREIRPEGFDVVIDATGAVSLVQGLLGLARPGGTVFIYGMCGESDRVSWSPYDIFRRQLTIKGSFAQVNCFERSLAFLRSGRISTSGIVTHRFSIDAYGDALKALRFDPTCLKAVIEP
jgi:D-arabinitol dehydrogenase (NADP+)